MCIRYYFSILFALWMTGCSFQSVAPSEQHLFEPDLLQSVDRVAVTPMYVDRVDEGIYDSTSTPYVRSRLVPGRYVDTFRYVQAVRDDSNQLPPYETSPFRRVEKEIDVVGRVGAALEEIPGVQATPLPVSGYVPVREVLDRARNRGCDAVIFVVYTEAFEEIATLGRDSSPSYIESPVLTLRLLDAETGQLLAGVSHAGARSVFPVGFRSWVTAFREGLTGALDDMVEVLSAEPSRNR